MKISRSIATTLGRVALALNNATETTHVNDQLAAMGYDTVRIDEGKALYTAAVQAKEFHDNTLDDQLRITNTLSKKNTETRKLYMKHVKLAKIEISGTSGGKNLLGLRKQQPDAFHEWTRQALEFYDRALKSPAILAMFSKFNIAELQLQEGYDMVAALIKLNDDQEKAKAASHKAKLDKDAALNALTKWHANLVKVARLALEDCPTLLEALGVNYNHTGPMKKPTDETPTPTDPNTPTDPDPDPPVEPAPESTPPAPEAALEDGRKGKKPSTDETTKSTDLDTPKTGRTKKQKRP